MIHSIKMRKYSAKINPKKPFSPHSYINYFSKWSSTKTVREYALDPVHPQQVIRMNICRKLSFRHCNNNNNEASIFWMGINIIPAAVKKWQHLIFRNCGINKSCCMHQKNNLSLEIISLGWNYLFRIVISQRYFSLYIGYFLML